MNANDAARTVRQGAARFAVSWVQAVADVAATGAVTPRVYHAAWNTALAAYYATDFAAEHDSHRVVAAAIEAVTPGGVS